MSIIVAEYIPFGANQIAQMNNNLGTSDRVQGGFFTALVDAESTGTQSLQCHDIVFECSDFTVASVARAPQARSSPWSRA